MAMERKGGGGETENGDAFLDLKRTPAAKSPHRYTKEELLDIKERPHSKQRPPCLSEKYDSDGVWDPEKWHASLYPSSGRSSPVESFKKDLDSDRTPLMRRLVDPRERVKDDDLDVVLSPQRRSFGGGCHVTTTVSSRRSGSPLEKENDGVRIIGGRRIGSGRIISARNFDKDHRGEKDLRDSRDRDRERDYKDKRFRREFGESKRVFGERRRNDSYTEEEPEWFSAGPTSQSETIELTGFDDKILEEDHKGRKRTRRRTASVKEGIVECNGGVAEEDEVEVILAQETAADQEVPREAVLPEQAPGEFDFNEFFNLDKVPGLASRNLESHLMSHPEIPSQPLPKNILQELLGPPVTRPASSNLLSGLMGSLEPTANLLGQRASSPPISQVFPTRASSADYLRPRIPSPLGFGPSSQQLLGDPFQGLRKPMSPVAAQQMSQLELQQAALEGLALPHELAMQTTNFYQPGFGKSQIDKNRDGFKNRQQRVIKSPAPGHRGNSASPAPSASITSMLSPSFTPTSVIRKMYESKEKSKEEPTPGKPTGDGKDENSRTNEDHLLSSSSVVNSDQDAIPPLSTKLSALQRSACSTPLSQTNRYTKEQDYRPKSTGRKTPTMASPIPGTPFLRPVHQVPLVSHVPVVRPSHQLHPGLVQRMLAQGVHPQHLPSLLQAGMIPPGVDLSHLQGISGPILGQPFYPLPTASHPLLNPRSGTPLQLAMMQQQLQRSVLHSPSSSSQGMTGGGQTTSQNTPGRSGLPHVHSQLDHRSSQRSGSPVGLAKWFGSDVLQQPLPSMPSKVISVDELEYRQ
ncbi:eukaryotic translation initiation factor 4E transporter isoform X5 [Ornithorhynchus anatinus]|uniref:eukaryotic translation initiation factor 4E transporter isoform X5 n=1 Tax=Ornithorhynchus anatinus TaxID=9258 RepID=UPI0010A815EF|nr:eukaryotic translation initiation factor 4E transporter isoform X5 [Ornithorhynchus anatinus]